MGIYDRDYYRGEGPSYIGALLPSGLICKWLIAINIVVFVAQLATRPDPQTEMPPQALQWMQDNVRALEGPKAHDALQAFQRELLRHSSGWFTNLFILDTYAVVREGQIWRLLTYAFLHSTDWTGGFIPFPHLLFNMVFLWWLGGDLEQLYGPREFLCFYLVSALLGGIAFTLWALARGEPGYCLGASGAVTALLVLCACHFPTRTILVFLVLPVPIWLFAILNVAQDAFVFLGPMKSPVAVVVHLAGAAFGLLYYRYHVRISPWLPSRLSWRLPRRRPKLKIYRDEPEPTREPVAVAAPVAVQDEHFEARLDAVLEKIARSGKESLTDGERQILVQASELYKKRRNE